MGWSTDYCSFCGLPLNVNKLYNNIKDTYYNLPKWIYTCTILFNNNKTIHNINWNLEYEKYNYMLIGGKPYGFIVIHCDCWKYIKKEKNIKLKYSDFPFVEKMYSSDDYIFYKFKVDYKKISNLQGQDFNLTKYINYGYSFESPLKKNKVLGNFIINIFNQLNIKADRVGPRVSATLYKNNDLLVGSDNNIWEISNKKWIKTKNIKTYTFSSDNLNNKILLKNLEKYFSYNEMLYENYRFLEEKYKDNLVALYSIPRLGEVSDCGLILKDIKIKFTNNSYKIKFVILYNDKSIYKLNEMIKNNFGLF